MKRVVILGRGGAGKSTMASNLAKRSRLPVIELDKYFWKQDLRPTPKNEWIKVQEQLTEADKWIMDGDLGKYDALESRLKVADTIIVLDFGLLRCFIRAIKRSSERADFWWWLFSWRLLSRPRIKKAINTYAPSADVFYFRSPSAVDKFLSKINK